MDSLDRLLKFCLGFFFLALFSFGALAEQQLKHLSQTQRLATSELTKDRFLYNVDAFRDLHAEQEHFVPERYFIVPFEYNILTQTASSQSRDVNAEVASVLQSIFATTYGMKMFNALKNAPIYTLKFSFFFSFSKTDLDSWTDSKLQTYIFVSQNGISRSHLARVLTHEIAQMTLRDAALTFTNLNIESRTLGPSVWQCTPEVSFARPDISILFSTLSAFQVENRVLSEIEGREYKPVGTCGERFVKLRRHSPAYLQALSKAMRSWSEQMPPSCSDDSILDFVQNYFLTEKGEELCQSLEKPIFLNRVLQNGTFGPRPNVGNGGGF